MISIEFIFTANLWMALLFSSLLLTTFFYLRQLYIERQTRNKFRGQGTIYSGVVSSVALLAKSNLNSTGSKDNFLNDILIKIQKVVELLFINRNIKLGNISTNLMHREINPDRLVIKYMGDYVEGRGNIGFDIPLDLNSPLLGAPMACIQKENVYIPDVLHQDFQNSITKTKENISVRSFISIPIWNKDKDCVGVLNVDSNLENQFVSKEFLEVYVYPALKIFLYLIRFTCTTWNDPRITSEKME